MTMAPPDNVSTLLSRRISWLKRVGEPKWFARVDGVECHLRMNDFPEEPLYTLEYRGDSLGLDDAPATWTIPG